MLLPLLLLLLSFAPVVFAQQTIEKRTYTTYRVNPHPPDIDGHPDDPAWEGVEWSGDFIQLRPYNGTAPSQQTAFKMLYDDDNLYFIIRAFDTNPEEVDRRVSRRDSFDSDWVEVNIDSYYDRRTAFSFTLSASGVKGDEAISNDGNNWDTSWDPVWYSATSVDDQGWIAEMRIPLSQLRFSNGENQVWGLQVNRRLFRKDERSSWQHIPNDAPGWVSYFGELRGIQGIKSARRIELVPYTLGNLSRYQKQVNNPFRSGQSGDARFGLDGKMGLTTNLTMNMTVNPDFGQVEADPSVVNLSAFEVFFEERRPFFVEGKNITEYRIGGGGSFGNDQLFYSRRIGRAPQRTPSLATGEFMELPDKTSIIGAVKITGKTPGGLSIGVLDAITEATNAEIDAGGSRSKTAVEPFTNYLVTRLQQDYNGGTTSIGGMVTATNRNVKTPGLDFLNRAAYAGGVDFQHQWSNRIYAINGNMSFSRIQGSRDALIRAQGSSVRYFQRPDADHVSFDSTRTSLSGHGGTLTLRRSGNSPWKFGLSGTWRSPGFELNDLGFLRGADVVMQTSWAGYQSNNPASIFRRYNVFVNQWQGWNFGRERTFFGGNINGGGQLNNYWEFWLSLDMDAPGLSRTALRGGPSYRTTSRRSLFVDVDTDNRKNLQFGLGGGYNWDGEGSGDSGNMGFSVRLRPSKAMSIQMNPFFNVNRDNQQYVATGSFQNPPLYMLGRIDQKTLGVTFRLNYSITPNLSVQYYGQPFVSAGRYSDFKRVTNPRASRYEDRFHTFTGNETIFDTDANEYRFDENLDGTSDYAIDNPDFNFRQFRSNLVVRWEYSPGSTLFLVWAQERTGFSNMGDFSARRDFNALFDVYPTNFFLVKFNYWFSL